MMMVVVVIVVETGVTEPASHGIFPLNDSVVA
jgi:hypothetical protein